MIQQDKQARPRFCFVMEQTLGHVTHYKNLRAAIDADTRIAATWYPLSFPPRGTLETIPVVRSNWSTRASLRARRLLAGAKQPYDALFFHSQATALFSTAQMRRIPTVISLDATPRNYDSVGAAYGHRQDMQVIERLKDALNRRALHAAGALVTWCDWARRSLITDYGVPVERITVIPPGVDLVAWPQPAPRRTTGPVRILFVGADFARKGGELLLQAFQSGGLANCELHLVTKAAVAPAPGIHVYRDVTPNSDLLRRLYAEADLFALPTLADCFPLAIQEALAAGLPVVATDVGAIGEAVHDGETGILVPPGDALALSAALTALAQDESRRRAMGLRARATAEQRFDCAINAQRVLSLLAGLTGR